MTELFIAITTGLSVMGIGWLIKTTTSLHIDISIVKSWIEEQKRVNDRMDIVVAEQRRINDRLESKIDGTWLSPRRRESPRKNG